MNYKIHIIYLPLLLALFVFMFITAYNEVEQQTIHDFNKQQLLLAKQTANSIEELFQHYQDLLSYLSGLEPIVKMNEEGQTYLKSFYRSNERDIRAITRVDENGRILYTFPFNSDVIGLDISYQEHVRDVIVHKKPTVSDVFKAVQNYRAVAYHFPVMENGVFKGSLAVLIPFDHITKKYLQDINLGSGTFSWVLSRKGIELYCPERSHIGESFFDSSPPNSSVRSLARKMIDGMEGVGIYHSGMGNNNADTSITMHAVYHPIRFANTYWSICIATPEEGVLRTMTGFRNKWLLIIALLIGGGSIYTFYFIRAWILVRHEKERLRTQEALKESEKRFRELAELLPQTVFETDDAGKLTFANSKAFEYFQYSQEDFNRGLNALEMLIPEERQVARENIAKTLKGEKTGINEYTALRKDGSTFPILIYSNTIMKNNEPVGLRGIIVDITEHKQNAEALKISERQFRSYIDNAPDGIFVLDKDGRFIELNNALCRITGYESSELEQNEFKALIPPEERYKMNDSLSSLRVSESFTSDDHFLKKDGTRGQWALDIVKIADNRYLGFTKDITERKSLEEQFRQAQKMEAIGQLAGGVAHDFNNLLTVISGYSTLLLAHNFRNKDTIDKLEQIKMAADRAESLTRQLLAFSRKQIAQPEVLDLNSVIRNSLKMMSRLIGEDISIELKLADELPYILADPHQIEQILINLIVNARDAIQELNSADTTKLITVETSPEHFDKKFASQHLDSTEGPRVLLSLSDTGIGIDQTVLDKIFDPFFTTKILGKGTGLGLSTVYGIVKQNQADIFVDSLPGQGTTFRIYWPLAHIDVEDLDNDNIPNKWLKGSETILLVEDDEPVRKFTSESLKKIGYKVLTANDGESALEQLKKKKKLPDLIITDLVMPGINGQELAEKLNRRYPDLPVILTSGYTDNHLLHNGFLKEGVHFLQKPFSIADLSEHIRDVLDKAR